MPVRTGAPTSAERTLDSQVPCDGEAPVTGALRNLLEDGALVSVASGAHAGFKLNIRLPTRTHLRSGQWQPLGSATRLRRAITPPADPTAAFAAPKAAA